MEYVFAAVLTGLIIWGLGAGMSRLAGFWWFGVGGMMASMAATGKGRVLAGLMTLMTCYVLAWLTGRLWTRKQSVPEAPSRHTTAAPGSRGTILVDGSNVAHWKDNSASLTTARWVVDELRRIGFVPRVFFDANIGWKSVGRDLTENELAAELGLAPDRVQMVPGGSQADAFLIEFARRSSVPIVSNDSFRDRLDPNHELQLIKGMVVGDQVLFDDLTT